jgi:hypothetical protein
VLLVDFSELCVGCDVVLPGPILKVGPPSLFDDFRPLLSRTVNGGSGFYRGYIYRGYRATWFLPLTSVIAFPVLLLPPYLSALVVLHACVYECTPMIGLTKIVLSFLEALA